MNDDQPSRMPDGFYEEGLELLLQASIDAMFVVLTDGTIFSANSAACSLFGYTLDELRQHGRNLIVDTDDPRLAPLLARREKNGAVTSDLRMRRKDGSVFEAALSSTTVPRPDAPTVALVVVRDLSERQHAQRLIAESEERRQFALDSAQIGDWDMDLRTNVARRSLRHDQCFGYQSPVAEWGYDTFLAHVHPADRQQVDAVFQRALAGDGAYDVEFRVIWPDGSLHWLWSKGRFYFDEAGAPIRVSGIQVEVTARRLAEQAMLLNTRAIESASNGIAIVDAQAPDMPLIYVNAAFEKITGYAASEILGRNCRFLNTPGRDPDIIRRLREALRDGREIQVEIQNFRKDGTPWWNELRISPVRDDSGIVTHFVGIQTDVTDRRRTEEALIYQANHDVLTGLPNRHLLAERLSQMVTHAAVQQESVCVIYIDLDRFKRFNDTLGHGAGDDILRQVAGRLEGAKRDGDTVGRLGGDEFLMLCRGLDRDGAGDLVNRLQQRLGQILVEEEDDIKPTASIGIAMFPHDGTTSVELMKNADLAMYAAKAAGRDRYQFFSSAMEAAAHTELTIERELRRALLRNEIYVEYQPQFNLATGALTGIEALARWKHATLGQVPPIEFIRVAEENGLIGALGAFILRYACRQHAAWIAAGLCSVPMAVNVSALQFREANFLDTLDGILRETGLDAGKLEIELTESVIMHGVEATIAKLNALRDRGLRLAIDDFGTGYSSLSYLRQFPVSRLKVDRSFVHDVIANKDSAAITTAIVMLSHSMGFETVAEGVEEEAQADFLRSLGCEHAQGYLYSRPVSAEVLEATFLGR